MPFLLKYAVRIKAAKFLSWQWAFIAKAASPNENC